MEVKEINKHTRRNFLRQLSFILASIAGFLVFISILRQFIPRVSQISRKIKLGKPGSFPLNTFTYIPEHKIFIYRDHSGLKAISAICTHLGCTIEKKVDGFQCPCHGSFFSEKGKVISGAASKDLPWYRLSKSMDGQIVVDLTKTVDADHRL
jgi:nitrite reductase/ring-hydroxylating ferredoxin subunit